MAQKKQKLEGQFIPLANSGPISTVVGTPLTDSDLDDMVSNFKSTSSADHIPVRFGRANGRGPVVAKVTALARDGHKLTGRLENVDPRFEELYQSGKLGGRSARSLAFQRDDETGKTLTELGFMPPRVHTAGGWHDAPCTDAALDDLLDAHRQGDYLEYCASDAGHIEFVISVAPREKSDGGKPLRKDEKLNQLAYARARERSISFCEALPQIAREHPELTASGGMARRDDRDPSGLRFQTNSERLTELARGRQEERGINFGEALSQVSHENPSLTLPDGVFCMADRTPKRLRNDEELTRRAKELQWTKKISFGEALSRIASQHPELTLPGMYDPAESEY